jgi:hypothetical protein
MEENKEIQISLREINEISFYSNPVPIAIEQIEFGKNLNLEIGFRFEVTPEVGIFKFFTSVKYTINELTDPVVGIETEIVFEIPNLSSVVKLENGEQLQVENNFLATLAGVCIGTTRGVLATNLKGSQMAKFPLPILNPTEILSNMNNKPKEIQ